MCLWGSPKNDLQAAVDINPTGLQANFYKSMEHVCTRAVCVRACECVSVHVP